MNSKVLSLFFIVFIFSAQLFGQTLVSPESVSYDKVKNRYIVSDPGSTAILQIAAGTGTITNFHNSGLFFPRGTTIVGNMLYVTDLGKLLGFNLTTDQLVVDTIIPTAQGLNDVVADDKGNLYMSDDVINQIFKFEIKDTIGYAWAKNDFDAPNGLWFDKANNRLIVVSFRDDSPIQAVDLTSKVVSEIKTTTHDYLDGIAVDKNGNYYISSWGSNTIYRYNSSFLYEKEFSKNHSGPADIVFIPEKDVIAVPNMNSGKIDYLPVSTISIDENPLLNKISAVAVKEKSTVKVNLQLDKLSNVTIELYDLSARLICNKVNYQLADGQHELLISANQSNAICLVKVTVNGISTIKKVSF